MYKSTFSIFLYLILAINLYGFERSQDPVQLVDEGKCSREEPMYDIVEAPLSMQKLWEDAPELFSQREHVKPHDNKWFSKWHQLHKLWSKDKNEAGHFERKESIVITSENNDLEMMKKCRRDMQAFGIQYLKDMERKYNLPEHILTMESAVKPTHTLRILHYLPKATATAHYDTSIMTCLYYRDSGLQLKIKDKWIEAPELKPNEMLVTYGIPGEILSNGHLKAVRHRVQCDERYAVVYFHNTPKDYVLESENYYSTTMAHVYQEAQLWYADVNARVVRHYCKSTQLPWYVVLYGWLAQKWSPVNENHLSKKESMSSDKKHHFNMDQVQVVEH